MWMYILIYKLAKKILLKYKLSKVYMTVSKGVANFVFPTNPDF